LTTTRHYGTVKDVQDEIVGARSWIGFHFRNAVEQGLDLGNRVAEWALDRYSRAFASRQGHCTPSGPSRDGPLGSAC
jgi:hypothetical protein